MTAAPDSSPPAPFEPEISKWELQYDEPIAKGAYGTVYKGYCRGQTVAVKLFHNQHLSAVKRQELKAEVEIMMRLRHPCLIMLMGVCIEPENIALVMEYVEGKSLDRILQDETMHLSMRQKLRLAKDIVKGLYWLHRLSPPIIHRDLKPANILVNSDLHVKLCDFGLSVVKTRASRNKEQAKATGTPVWMAPEVMMGKPATEKSDIYALAIVLWELFTRKDPSEGTENVKLFMSQVVNERRRPPIPQDMHPSLRHLIESCWKDDPRKRPDCGTILRMLDEVTVDVSIRDPIGKDIWKSINHKPGDLCEPYPFSAEWERFAASFSAKINRSATNDVDFLCLRVMLGSTETNQTRSRQEKVTRRVFVDDFGRFLNQFGPISDNKVDILTRFKNVCANKWFHGQVDKKTAELRLLGKPKGSFLVRTTNEWKRCFYLSRVDKHSRVIHHPITRNANGDYVIRVLAHPKHRYRDVDAFDYDEGEYDEEDEEDEEDDEDEEEDDDDDEEEEEEEELAKRKHEKKLREMRSDKGKRRRSGYSDDYYLYPNYDRNSDDDNNTAANASGDDHRRHSSAHHSHDGDHKDNDKDHGDHHQPHMYFEEKTYKDLPSLVAGSKEDLGLTKPCAKGRAFAMIFKTGVELEDFVIPPVIKGDVEQRLMVKNLQLQHRLRNSQDELRKVKRALKHHHRSNSRTYSSDECNEKETARHRQQQQQQHREGGDKDATVLVEYDEPRERRAHTMPKAGRKDDSKSSSSGDDSAVAALTAVMEDSSIDDDDDDDEEEADEEEEEQQENNQQRRRSASFNKQRKEKEDKAHHRHRHHDHGSGHRKNNNSDSKTSNESENEEMEDLKEQDEPEDRDTDSEADKSNRGTTMSSSSSDNKAFLAHPPRIAITRSDSDSFEGEDMSDGGGPNEYDPSLSSSSSSSSDSSTKKKGHTRTLSKSHEDVERDLARALETLKRLQDELRKKEEEAERARRELEEREKRMSSIVKDMKDQLEHKEKQMAALKAALCLSPATSSKVERARAWNGSAASPPQTSELNDLPRINALASHCITSSSSSSNPNNKKHNNQDGSSMNDAPSTNGFSTNVSGANAFKVTTADHSASPKKRKRVVSELVRSRRTSLGLDDEMPQLPKPSQQQKPQQQQNKQQQPQQQQKPQVVEVAQQQKAVTNDAIAQKTGQQQDSQSNAKEQQPTLVAVAAAANRNKAAEKRKSAVEQLIKEEDALSTEGSEFENEEERRRAKKKTKPSASSPDCSNTEAEPRVSQQAKAKWCAPQETNAAGAANGGTAAKPIKHNADAGDTDKQVAIDDDDTEGRSSQQGVELRTGKAC